jgi:hypothetical protein
LYTRNGLRKGERLASWLAFYLISNLKVDVVFVSHTHNTTQHDTTQHNTHTHTHTHDLYSELMRTGAMFYSQVGGMLHEVPCKPKYKTTLQICSLTKLNTSFSSEDCIQKEVKTIPLRNNEFHILNIILGIFQKYHYN